MLCRRLCWFGIALYCIVLWRVVCIVLYALYAIALYGILAALTRGGGGCGRVWEKGWQYKSITIYYPSPHSPNHTTPHRTAASKKFNRFSDVQVVGSLVCVLSEGLCRGVRVAGLVIYRIVYPAVKSLDFVLICYASALRRLQ